MDEPAVDIKVGDRVKWKRHPRRGGYSTGRIYDILDSVAVIEGDDRWFRPMPNGKRLNVYRYKVPIERIVQVISDGNHY